MNEVKNLIIDYEMYCNGALDEMDFDWLDYVAYNDPSTIEIIDTDHDSGDYNIDDGDYIKLLDWLEETGRDYPIKIHSQNPVGVENMRRIIQRNNWKEVK